LQAFSEFDVGLSAANFADGAFQVRERALRSDVFPDQRLSLYGDDVAHIIEVLRAVALTRPA